MADRRAGGKIPADAGHLPRARERQHRAGRPREKHKQHADGHREHQRRAKPGHLPRDPPGPVFDDNLKGTRGGLQQLPDAGHERHEVRRERGREQGSGSTAKRRSPTNRQRRDPPGSQREQYSRGNSKSRRVADAGRRNRRGISDCEIRYIKMETTCDRCEKCEENEKRYKNRLWWVKAIVSGILYYMSIRVAFHVGRNVEHSENKLPEIEKIVKEKLKKKREKQAFLKEFEEEFDKEYRRENEC